jgi:hypothetical protein
VRAVGAANGLLGCVRLLLRPRAPHLPSNPETNPESAAPIYHTQWEPQAQRKVENDIRSEDLTDGVRGLRHTDAMDAPVGTMDELYAHAANAKPLFDGVVRGLADAVGVSNPHYVVTLPLKVRQASPRRQTWSVHAYPPPPRSGP